MEARMIHEEVPRCKPINFVRRWSIHVTCDDPSLLSAIKDVFHLLSKTSTADTEFPENNPFFP